jgi:hypothetical protein
MSSLAETVCWVASLCIAALIGAACIHFLIKDRKANAAKTARKTALEACIKTWLSEISATTVPPEDVFERLYKTRVADFKKLLVGMEKDFWMRQAEFDGLTHRLGNLQASEFNGRPKPPKEMLSEKLNALITFLNQH